MHSNSRRFWTIGPASRGGLAALFVAVAILMTAAAAIAAHPKRGSHFNGTTSGSAVNGFLPPVTFTVSSNGGTLMRFDYSTFGCFGAGGFRPGIDYYTKPGAIIKVGKIKVSGSGHFSVKGVVSVYSIDGFTTTTTSKVSGRFTSSRAASGTVTFSQKLSGKSDHTSCGPGTLTFTAKGH